MLNVVYLIMEKVNLTLQFVVLFFSGGTFVQPKTDDGENLPFGLQT